MKRGSYHGALFIALILFSSPFFVPFLVRAVTLPENLAGGGTAAGTFTTSGVTGVSSGGGSTGGSTGGGSTGSGTSGGTSPSSAPSQTTQKSKESGSTDKNANSYPTCKVSATSVSKTSSSNVASSCNASCAPASGQVYDCTKAYNVKCNLNGKVVTNVCNKTGSYSKDGVKISTVCTTAEKDIACKATQCDGKPCTQAQQPTGTGSTGSGKTDGKDGSPTTPGSGSGSGSGSGAGSETPDAKQTVKNFNDCVKQGISKDCAGDNFPEYYKNNPVDSQEALRRELIAGKIACQTDVCRAAHDQEINNLNMSLGQPQFQPIGSQSPGTGGSSVSPTQYNQPTLPHTLPQQFTGANQPGAYQPFKSAGISPEFQPTGSLGTYQQLAGQSILTSAFRPYAPPPMFTQQPLTTQPSFVAPSSFYSPSSLSPAPPPLQQTSYTLPPQYSLSQSAYQQYKSAIAPSTFAPSQTGYQLPAGFSGESNIPYPQTWTQRAGAALVNAGTSAQEAVQALQTYASQGATSLGNYAQSIINPQNQAGSSIGDITNNYPPSFSTQAGANQPNITGATPQSDISMQYPPGFSYFAGATQPNVLGQVPQQGQNILSQYPQSWQNLSLNTGGVPALSTNVPGLGTGGNIGTAAPLDWATQKLSEARDYLQNYQSAVSMGSAEAGQRLSMSQALGCQMSPTACLGGVSSNGIPLALNGSPLYQQIALGQATAPGVGAIPGANLGNPFFGTQTGWQAFNLNGWNPPLAPIGRGGSFESGGGGGGGSQLPFFASDQSYLSADLSGVKAPAAGTLANNVAGISSPAPYANLSGLGTNPTIGKYDFANGVKILPYGSSQLDSALGLRPESGVARNYSAIDSFMQSHTGTTFSPSSVINTPLSSRDAFLASQGITPGSQLGSITEDSLLRMSPTPSRDLVTPRTESGIPFSPPEQSSIGSMYNKNLTPYDDGASAAERARQKMEGLKTNIDDAQVRVDIAAGPYQASEAALKEAENKMRDADFAKFTYDINHLSASHNGVVSKDPKTGDPVYKYSQADYPKAVELQKSVNDSITAYNKALTTRNINAEILNNAIQDHTAAVQTYNNMPARDQALASIGNSIQATNDPVAREQLSHLAGGLANLDSYYGEQAAKQLLSNPSTVEGKFSNQILTDSLAAMDRYGTTGNVLRADYADYMAKQAMNLQPRSPEYTNTLNAAIAEAKRIETGGIDWGYAPRTARDYLAGLSANADRAWQSTSWTEQPGSKAIAGALKVGDFLTTGFAGSMLTSGLNVTGLESLSQKQFDLVNKTPAEISQEQGIHAINLIAVPALGPAAGAVGRGFVAGATWIGERAGPALTRAIETVAGPIGLESRAIIPTSNIRSSINIGGATVSFGDDLARSAGLGTQARLGTAGQFEQAFPTVGRAPSSGISRSLLESPIARLGSETPVARFGGAIGDSYAAGVPRTTTPLTISSIPNASGVRELAYRPPANDNIAPGSAPSGNLTLIQGGKVEAPILQRSATQRLDDFMRANDLPTYVPPVKSDVQLFYEQQAARQAAQSGNVVQFPSGKPFTPSGAVRDLPFGERTGVSGGGAAPASAATKYPTPEQLFRYESREPSVSVYSKKCDVCYLGGDHTGIVIDPGVKPGGGPAITLPKIAGVDTTKPFTLSADAAFNKNPLNIFSREVNYLVKSPNLAGDIRAIASGKATLVEVRVPAGVTTEQFAQRIVRSFNELPDTVSQYRILGSNASPIKCAGNCNNFTTEMLSRAGMSLDEIATLRPTTGAIGFGKPVFDPSLSAQGVLRPYMGKEIISYKTPLAADVRRIPETMSLPQSVANPLSRVASYTERPRIETGFSTEAERVAWRADLETRNPQAFRALEQHDLRATNVTGALDNAKIVLNQLEETLGRRTVADLQARYASAVEKADALWSTKAPRTDAERIAFVDRELKPLLRDTYDASMDYWSSLQKTLSPEDYASTIKQWDASLVQRNQELRTALGRTQADIAFDAEQTSRPFVPEGIPGRNTGPALEMEGRSAAADGGGTARAPTPINAAERGAIERVNKLTESYFDKGLFRNDVPRRDIEAYSARVWDADQQLKAAGLDRVRPFDSVDNIIIRSSDGTVVAKPSINRAGYFEIPASDASLAKINSTYTSSIALERPVVSPGVLSTELRPVTMALARSNVESMLPGKLNLNRQSLTQAGGAVAQLLQGSPALAEWPKLSTAAQVHTLSAAEQSALRTTVRGGTETRVGSELRTPRGEVFPFVKDANGAWAMPQPAKVLPQSVATIKAIDPQYTGVDRVLANGIYQAHGLYVGKDGKMYDRVAEASRNSPSGKLDSAILHTAPPNSAIPLQPIASDRSTPSQFKYADAGASRRRATEELMHANGYYKAADGTYRLPSDAVSPALTTGQTAPSTRSTPAQPGPQASLQTSRRSWFEKVTDPTGWSFVQSAAAKDQLRINQCLDGACLVSTPTNVDLTVYDPRKGGINIQGDGRHTANGERTNIFSDTIATPLYPLGTVVKVTLNTGASRYAYVADTGGGVKYADMMVGFAQKLGVRGTTPGTLEPIANYANLASADFKDGARAASAVVDYLNTHPGASLEEAERANMSKIAGLTITRPATPGVAAPFRDLQDAFASAQRGGARVEEAFRNTILHPLDTAVTIGRTFSDYARHLAEGAKLINPRAQMTVAPGETVTPQLITEILFNHYASTEKVDRFGNFAHKDAEAAQRAGMSLQEYVIGGMDSDFRISLFNMFMAMEEAGLHVGITSGFRSDDRQAAVDKRGIHANPTVTWHGGSAHGGYGHGLAADIVGINGTSNVDVWHWVDTHGLEYGIGRPYGNRDAPHVAPTKSMEYTGRHGEPRIAYTRTLATAKENWGLTAQVAFIEPSVPRPPVRPPELKQPDAALAFADSGAAISPDAFTGLSGGMTQTFDDPVAILDSGSFRHLTLANAPGATPVTRSISPEPAPVYTKAPFPPRRPALLADIQNPFAGKTIASLSGTPASFLPQLIQPVAPINNPLAQSSFLPQPAQLGGPAVPKPPSRPASFASNAPLPPVRPTAALEALAQAEARAAADALAQAQKATNESLAKAQAKAAEAARTQIAAEDALARARQINEGLAQAQEQAAQAAREKIAAEDALALIKKITNANLARIQEQVAQAQRAAIAAEDAQAARDAAAVRDQAASAEYDRLAALAQAQQKHLVDAQAKAAQDAADEKAAARAKEEAQRLADAERALKIAESEKEAAKVKSDAAIAEYERLAAEFQARARARALEQLALSPFVLLQGQLSGLSAQDLAAIERAHRQASANNFNNSFYVQTRGNLGATSISPVDTARLVAYFAGTLKLAAPAPVAPSPVVTSLGQPSGRPDYMEVVAQMGTEVNRVDPLVALDLARQEAARVAALQSAINAPLPPRRPADLNAQQNTNVPLPPQRPSNIRSVVAPKTVVDINRTLRLGSIGEDVSHWQEFLVSRGYGKDSSGKDMPLDGIFGSRTEQATREFQRAVGVRVDGVFGPETRAVLREEPPAASQRSAKPGRVSAEGALNDIITPEDQFPSLESIADRYEENLASPRVTPTPTETPRTPFQKFLNWLTTPSQWLNPVSPAPAEEGSSASRAYQFVDNTPRIQGRIGEEAEQKISDVINNACVASGIDCQFEASKLSPDVVSSRREPQGDQSVLGTQVGVRVPTDRAPQFIQAVRAGLEHYNGGKGAIGYNGSVYSEAGELESRIIVNTRADGRQTFGADLLAKARIPNAPEVAGQFNDFVSGKSAGPITQADYVPSKLSADEAKRAEALREYIKQSNDEIEKLKKSFEEINQEFSKKLSPSNIFDELVWKPFKNLINTVIHPSQWFVAPPLQWLNPVSPAPAAEATVPANKGLAGLTQSRGATAQRSSLEAAQAALRQAAADLQSVSAVPGNDQAKLDALTAAVQHFSNASAEAADALQVAGQTARAGQVLDAAAAARTNLQSFKSIADNLLIMQQAADEMLAAGNMSVSQQAGPNNDFAPLREALTNAAQKIRNAATEVDRRTDASSNPDHRLGNEAAALYEEASAIEGIFSAAGAETPLQEHGAVLRARAEAVLADAKKTLSDGLTADFMRADAAIAQGIRDAQPATALMKVSLPAASESGRTIRVDNLRAALSAFDASLRSLRDAKDAVSQSLAKNPDASIQPLLNGIDATQAAWNGVRSAQQNLDNFLTDEERSKLGATLDTLESKAVSPLSVAQYTPTSIIKANINASTADLEAQIDRAMQTVSAEMDAIAANPSSPTSSVSPRTPIQKFLNWLTTPSQWLNPVSPAPAAEVQNPRSSLGDLFKPSAETLEAEAQKTAAVQETAKILSQEAQKIGLPIGEISKVADVSLFVPSSRGQYIVEIRLQHKAPLTDQVTVGDVSSTADVQKDALTIIKNIAASRPSTQFFMEGAGDNFASEMASSKQQYDQFRKIADVEIAATKGQPDVRKIMATFANYHKATVGGALTPTLTETYAASLLNDLNARNISLPQDAQTYLNGLISTPYNNLSDVALYRKGALEVAYLQGDIQSVAGAENESLVNALSLANKSAQRSYIDNVNQDRESYMAQSIVKQLTASNASFVVFPVGGTHDLSQEIKAADDGVGYIVLTPHSYPKESLNVFGQRSELTPIPVTSAETAPASPATTETPRTPMQKFLNWLTTPSQWLNPVSPAPAAEVPVPPRRPVGLEVEVSSPAPTLTDPFAGKRLVLYGGQVSPTPQPDFLPTLEQAGYLQDQLLQMYGFTPALLPKNISQQVAASILPPAPSAYPIALPPQTNPMMQIPTIILSDKEIDLIVQEATDKLNAYWTDVFAQHDLSYGPVKVVLYGGHFDTSTHSDATSYDSGSYFNHPDQTIYMDRSSLRMQSLFWANANGVTIMESVAHEMGHYVANLTGAYTAALSRTSYDPNFHHFYLPGDTVQLGQRKELQADYLAGVSMRGAGLLSQGDPQNIFYEAVTSGDDYGKILVGTKPNADELKNDNDPHGTSAERAQTIYAGLLPTGSVEIGLAMLGTPLPWVEPNTLGSQGPALPFELAPALATAGRYQADVSVSAGAEKSAFTSGDAGKALKTSMDGVTKVDLLAGKVKDIALYGLSANDSNMLYTAADTLSVEAKGISKNIIMAAESANGKMTPALRSALENGSVATRLSASSEKLLNQAKDMIARQNALMKAQTPVPTSVIEGVSPAIPQTPGLSGQSIQEGASIPSGFTTPQPGASSPPISVPAQTAPPINPNRTFLEKVWDAITHPSQLSFTQSAPAAEVGAPASTAAVPDTVFGKLMADAVREQFALQNAEYAAQQANRSAGQKILNALSMSKSWAGPSIAEVERISVEAAALEYAKEADMACAAFGFNPVGTCTVAMTGVFALETSNFSVGENSTAQGTDNANSGGLAQLTWDTAPLVWNVLEHNAAFRQRFMDGPNGYIHNFRDFWNAIQGFDWRINGPWVFAAHATLNNSGRDLNDQSTLERVLHRYNASPTYPAVVRNNMTILLGYGQPGQFPTTQSGRPQSTPLMQAMMGVMNKYPLAGIASTRVAANNPMAYAQANANAQMANAFLRPDSGWATEDTTVYTGPVQPDAAVVDATPKPDPTLEPRKETLQQSLAALQASGKAALDAGAVADRNKAAEPVEALKYAAQALRAGEKALQDAAKVAVAAGDTTGIKQSIDGLISEVESTARRIDAGVADPGFLNANLLPFKDTLEPQIRDFESRGQALTAQAQKVANAELARITESQSAVQHVVVVPTEKLSFTEYAGVPSPHQPSQPAPQINPTVKSRIVGNIPAQAHPRILIPAQYASATLPPGYTVILTPHGVYRANPSIYDSMHGPLHTEVVDGQMRASAIDFQIIDPQGQPLQNIQSPQNFQIYWEFAKNWKAFHDALYPTRTDEGRWGGFFSDVANDMMHIDLKSRTQHPTAAGSWEHGLSAEYQKFAAPGQNTSGMGPIASYQIIDRSGTGLTLASAKAGLGTQVAGAPQVVQASRSAVQRVVTDFNFNTTNAIAYVANFFAGRLGFGEHPEITGTPAQTQTQESGVEPQTQEPQEEAATQPDEVWMSTGITFWDAAETAFWTWVAWRTGILSYVSSFLNRRPNVTAQPVARQQTAGDNAPPPEPPTGVRVPGNEILSAANDSESPQEIQKGFPAALEGPRAPAPQGGFPAALEGPRGVPAPVPLTRGTLSLRTLADLAKKYPVETVVGGGVVVGGGLMLAGIEEGSIAGGAGPGAVAGGTGAVVGGGAGAGASPAGAKPAAASTLGPSDRPPFFAVLNQFPTITQKTITEQPPAPDKTVPPPRAPTRIPRVTPGGRPSYPGVPSYPGYPDGFGYHGYGNGYGYGPQSLMQAFRMSQMRKQQEQQRQRAQQQALLAQLARQMQQQRQQQQAAAQQKDTTLPTLQFTASPATVARNASTTLSWTSTNTNDCYIFDAAGKYLTGGKSSGSYPIGAVFETTSYGMTCTSYGYGQNVYATTTVRVATSTSGR